MILEIMWGNATQTTLFTHTSLGLDYFVARQMYLCIQPAPLVCWFGIQFHSPTDSNLSQTPLSWFYSVLGYVPIAGR